MYDRHQQRVVNISIHPEFVDYSTRPKHINDKEYMQTIGYMALWGNPDIVEIYVAKDGEITGHYYRNNDEGITLYFVMGGIPNSITGEYSIHS